MTEPKPIEERFAIALSELIGMCMDAGMDDAAIIASLKAELLRTRQNILPSKSEDKFNAERGLPPMSEADIREALALESYEPIPPQLEG